MNSFKKIVRNHYHWVIAFVVCLEMIVFGGILNSLSIYVIPITESLGISRGLFSIIGVGLDLGVVVSTMLTTRLFHRFGYRKVVTASLAVLAFSVVITGLATNPWVYGIGKILFGLGYGACHTAGATWIVKHWFHKHYGLVLGIVTMGTGLGGGVFSTFLTAIMEALNWRWAHAISAAMLVALMLLMLLLLRDVPDQIGLKPYGEGQHDVKGHIKRRITKSWPGISVAETKRHPAYWLLILCIFLVRICVTLTSSVFVPYFQDSGYSAMAAARYQSIYMYSLAIAKLLCGWASEKIGGKAVGILCIVCAAVGQWCLADVSDSVMAFVMVAVFSVSMTLTSVSIPLLTEAIFGTETSTSITGTVLGVTSFSGIVAAPISNMCYDTIGSYSPVFQAAAIVDVAMIGLLFVICRMFGVKEKQYRKKKTVNVD